MRYCKNCNEDWELFISHCGYCGTRLEEVEGSEQKLVGESRSDGPASDAEKRSGERRGVGEIVELSELLRHIDRKIEEAQGSQDREERKRPMAEANFQKGKVVALTALRKHVNRIAEERSDLPNSQ